MIETLIVLNWFILVYLIIVGVFYIILSAASVQEAFLRYDEIAMGDLVSIMRSNVLPPVTALIAAYNEEVDIHHTIRSILHSDYPNIFILIVNDGSTDNTMQILIDEYDLQKVHMETPQYIKNTSKVKGYYVSRKYSNITVVDKEHCDKSDTLNVGINACHTPLFITIDADTLVERDAISEIVFCMMTKSHAIAIGGAVYISNGCKFEDGEITSAKMPYKFIPAYQACEYLRSFLFNRTGWNLFGGSVCYSGAFTLFEHRRIVDIGGFEVGNFANDFEIVTHLQFDRLKYQQPYQILCTPAATCWTDVPASLKSFWRQRTLWQEGTLQSLLRYRKMFFNYRYKMVGLLNYPFFLLGEALNPLVEFTAYISLFLSWYLGILNGKIALMFVLFCWGFVILLTLSSVLLSIVTYNKYTKLRDVPWILFVLVFEFFGFRQLHVLCRVIATVKYFLGMGYLHKVKKQINQSRS